MFNAMMTKVKYKNINKNILYDLYCLYWITFNELFPIKIYILDEIFIL